MNEDVLEKLMQVLLKVLLLKPVENYLILLDKRCLRRKLLPKQKKQQRL